MVGKLIITHGLPGSGKTTLAMKIIQKDSQNIVRANRDTIREQLFGVEYHSKTPDKKSEQHVSNIQEEIIKKGLREGKTVIVDDTNLNKGRIQKLFNLSKIYNVEIEQIHCDVPIDECKRRNKKRASEGGREVPEFVIDNMAKNTYDEEGHLKDFILSKNGVFIVSKNTPGRKIVDNFNKELENKNPSQGKAIFVVDMDGTLFNNHKDSVKHLHNREKRDYKGFYESIEKAPVNKKVLNLINNLYDKDNITIFAITGRSDDYAQNLINALNKSGAKISKLIMKREGDMRPSSEHKKDTVQELQKQGYIITGAIDDREQDIRMFQELGIMTSIVAIPETHNGIDYEEPDINTIYGSGYCIRCGSKLKDPNKNIGDHCRTKI